MVTEKAVRETLDKAYVGTVETMRDHRAQLIALAKAAMTERFMTGPEVVAAILKPVIESNLRSRMRSFGA